jgi:signal transduction histidine kinase
MRRHKDFLVAALAVAVIVAIGSLVIAAVVDARNAGKQRLGQLQVAQVQQLARSMDTRVQQAFSSFEGLLTVPYHATPRDAQDAARLKQLQNLNPKATTGYVLVNRNGVVVNGTLLRNPGVIGTRLTRPGLAQVLAGHPAMLPVAPGLTTALPTIALAYPLKTASGAPNGAFIAEVEVSPTAQFNQEVAPLAGTHHAQFSFVDDAGAVIASNRASTIGHRLAEPLLAAGPGLHRGHGDVVVTEPVPSAAWRAVFRQPSSDFEGSLISPLRSALVYLALLTIAIAGFVAVLLLRRLSRAREEQRRLNQIGIEREEFISIVSHELRTPVAGLLGFLQTTLDHWEDLDDTGRRRAVSRAWANATRLYSLSRDVLDSASLESGHLTYNRQLFDLAPLLRATVTATRETLEDRRITVDGDDAPIWIDGDADRLQQVLTNLLDNAIKATPPDGTVSVNVTRPGDRAAIAVQDSGAGLSQEDLARVFDKFVRGRGSRTVGTGLCLYISQQIVAAHGGELTASNAPAGGAVFTIDLPIARIAVRPASG